MSHIDDGFSDDVPTAMATYQDLLATKRTGTDQDSVRAWLKFLGLTYRVEAPFGPEFLDDTTFAQKLAEFESDLLSRDSASAAKTAKTYKNGVVAERARALCRNLRTEGTPTYATTYLDGSLKDESKFNKLVFRRWLSLRRLDAYGEVIEDFPKPDTTQMEAYLDLLRGCEDLKEYTRKQYADGTQHIGRLLHRPYSNAVATAGEESYDSAYLSTLPEGTYERQGFRAWLSARNLRSNGLITEQVPSPREPGFDEHVDELAAHHESKGLAARSITEYRNGFTAACRMIHTSYSNDVAKDDERSYDSYSAGLLDDERCALRAWLEYRELRADGVITELPPGADDQQSCTEFAQYLLDIAGLKLSTVRAYVQAINRMAEYRDLEQEPRAEPREARRWDTARRRAQLIEAARAQHTVPRIKYSHLLELVLSDGQKGKEWERHVNVTFNHWLDFRGSLTDVAVGPELFDRTSFEEAKTGFDQYLTDSERAIKTVRNEIAILNNIQRRAASEWALLQHGSAHGLLRQTREDRGLSQAALAVKADVSQQTLQRWEAGRSRAAPEFAPNVASIEKALQLPAGALGSLVIQEYKAHNAARVASPLGTLLADARAELGWSQAQVAREIGVQFATYNYWEKKGGFPGAENRKRALPKIAKVLNIELSDLRDACGPLAIQSLHYRLPRAKWNKNLRDAWAKITQWKTKGDDALVGTARSKWSVRPGPGRNKKRVGSANKYESDLSSFFGFLVLEAAVDPKMSGLGLNRKDIRITDLFRWDYISKYLAFLEARAGGVTISHLDFLTNVVAQHVRKRTGWAWVAGGSGEYPKLFALKKIAKESLLGSSRDHFLLLEGDGKTFEDVAGMDAGQRWRLHCEMLFRQCWNKRSELVGQVDDSSDVESFRNLGTILKLERPMEVLEHLTKRVRARLERNGLKDVTRFVAMRALLFTEMAMRTPLRREHWTLLDFRPDGKGRLRRTDDGYEMVIPKHEFKALSGAKKSKNYEAAFKAGPVVTLLDEYLAFKEELFPGTHEVFLTNEGASMTPGNFTSWVSQFTRLYVGDFTTDGDGFTPHAWRHIMATTLIKADGTSYGFELAANLLHNQIDTIRKVYSWINVRDKTATAMDQVEALLNREAVDA